MPHANALERRANSYDPKFPIDVQLAEVNEAVKKCVTESARSSRLASDAEQHEWLWDNVGLYMLGYGKEIAIVEDKYKPELNPNVAKEWGCKNQKGV